MTLADPGLPAPRVLAGSDTGALFAIMLARSGRGALYGPVPAGWLERADLDGLGVPILGVHGSDDPVSPLGRVRDRYAAAAPAELVRITGGRHDVFNDQTHRTVAAVVVLFLERIRQDSGPGPIAVPERLGR